MDYTEHSNFYNFWKWQYVKRNSEFVALQSEFESLSRRLRRLEFSLQRKNISYYIGGSPAFFVETRSGTVAAVDTSRMDATLQTPEQAQRLAERMKEATPIVKRVLGLPAIIRSRFGIFSSEVYRIRRYRDDGNTRTEIDSSIDCFMDSTFTDNPFIFEEVKFIVVAPLESIKPKFVDGQFLDYEIDFSVSYEILKAEISLLKWENDGEQAEIFPPPDMETLEVQRYYEDWEKRGAQGDALVQLLTYQWFTSKNRHIPLKYEPRLVGMWLHDYTILNNAKDVEAIRAIREKKSIVDALGYSASSERVIQRFLTSTRACIDAGAIIPFK
jgi:hypothetical protein